MTKEIKEKIKSKLEIQIGLIYQSFQNVNFLINYKKECDLLGNQPKGLISVYNLAKDQLIINLFKLLELKEHYSFSKLNKDYRIEFSATFEKIKPVLKKMNKHYRELNINTIRNKHIGHTDEWRKKESINWNNVKELILSCKECHDLINESIFNATSYIEIDQTDMAGLFYVYKFHKEIRNQATEMKLGNRKSLEINKI